MGKNVGGKKGLDALLEEAMTDCYGRFFATLSDELLSDRVHLYFQIQNAYWWYCDHWKANSGGLLPKMRIGEFGEKCVCECQVLKDAIGVQGHDTLLKEWRDYKMAIPIRGVIMLDPTYEHCLMIETAEGDTWMFPRGKQDEGEEDVDCAGRESWEETGIDVRSVIDNRFFIEKTIDKQNVKLFVVPGVSMDVRFEPRTRYEAKAIKWFKLSDLPTKPSDSEGGYQKMKESTCKVGKKGSLWQVVQFVPHALYWAALFSRCPTLPPRPSSPHITPIHVPQTITPAVLHLFQRASLETLDLLFRLPPRTKAGPHQSQETLTNAQTQKQDATQTAEVPAIH